MKYIFLLITFCILSISCEEKNNKNNQETKNPTVSTTNTVVHTQEQIEEQSQTDTFINNEYSEEYEEEEEYYEYGEDYEESIGGNDIPICDADLSEFITYISVEIPSRSGYKHSYTEMPLIIKNDICNFSLEAYPYDIYFKVIPKVSDTLIVSKAIDAEVECSNCLEMISIKSFQNGTLYSHISQNENIIARRGDIDNVLEEQDLSYSDLEIDDYSIKDYEFMNTDYTQELLERDYILNSDTIWIENNSIADIHNKITSSSISASNLDSLKHNYEYFIVSQKEVTIDNLLMVEKEGFFHSGAFTVEKGYHMLFETINIIYISPKNTIYTVEWLNDWEELVSEDYGPPLDDNTVTVVDGTYKIDDWDNDSEINLFHPDMEYGDYLVIYEAKLKGRDVYIQSPINVIPYKKP